MSYVKVGKHSYDMNPAIYPMVNQEELKNVLLSGRLEEQTLIMELYLKYGMRVIGYKKVEDGGKYGAYTSYVMEKNGAPVGRASVANKKSYDGSTTVEYRFRTPLFNKDRGRDKNLWSSVSLKHLIKAINFMSDGNTMNRLFSVVDMRQTLVSAARNMGEANAIKPWKSEVSRYDCDNDTYVALIRMFGGMGKDNMSPEVIVKLTEAYTKLIMHDSLNAQYKQRVLGAFRDEFYIAFQYHKYFALGKLKIVPDGATGDEAYKANVVIDMGEWAHGTGNEHAVLTQPLVLYSSLDEAVESDPAFVAAITMARVDVSNTDKQTYVMEGHELLPVEDKHYAAAGVETYYRTRITSDCPMCIVVPAYVPVEAHA